MEMCRHNERSFQYVDPKLSICHQRMNADSVDCGGCNFGLGSVKVGVDCTGLYDGGVVCMKGRCVPVSG